MPAAAVFFEVNILILGGFKFLQWYYATAGRRLVESSMADSEISQGLKLNLVTPSVALIAIAVAGAAPDYSTMLFMLIPFLLGLVRRI